MTLLRDHLSTDDVIKRLSTWTDEQAPSDEVVMLFFVIYFIKHIY